jgi:hypothetical protein
MVKGGGANKRDAGKKLSSKDAKAVSAAAVVAGPATTSTRKRSEEEESGADSIDEEGGEGVFKERERYNVSECMEMLLEKKVRIRESALNKLTLFLRSSSSSFNLSETSAVTSLISMIEEPASKDGICAILLRLMKKSEAREVKLVLTLLPLLALLAGAEQVESGCDF